MSHNRTDDRQTSQRHPSATNAQTGESDAQPTESQHQFTHTDPLLFTPSLHVILPTFIESERIHSFGYIDPNHRPPTALLSVPPPPAYHPPNLLRSQSSPAKVRYQASRRFSQDSGFVRNASTNFNRSDPHLRSSIAGDRAASPNLTGGSKPLSDAFKAPLPPVVVHIGDQPTTASNSSNLSEAESSGTWDTDTDTLQPLQAPKTSRHSSVYFNSSDAFGSTIPRENIPGTPMDPAEYGGTRSSATDPYPVGDLSASNQIALINELVERRRLSLEGRGTRPTTPIPENNLSANHYSNNNSSRESIGDGTNHASQTYNNSINSNNTALTAFNSKRPSLSLSVLEIVENRKNSKQDKEGLDPESLMFRDGRRKIDMVLCYEEEDEGVMTEQEARRRETRATFLENLVKEGLELETEDKSQSFDEKTYFVKVHMPWKTETRYAEVLNMSLPIRKFITISVKDEEKKDVMKLNTIRRWLRRFKEMIELDPMLMENEPTFYSATAGGTPEEQFIVKDRCTSYTSAQRSLIVMQILLRAKFDNTEKSGIRRLINEGAFLAHFPLHEGRYDIAHSSGTTFDRRTLYLEWARPKKWYKRQPLCLVRKYFGDKIGLYFCWLGFYTNMLIYPSIVGTICFIYGLASMNSDDNTPSAEICNESGLNNITLCPLCDKACEYQQLSNSCLFARITYLFDNPSTVFFAIFMSFWATTFLEMWKRKQAVIVWEWDLQNIENDEENRPEFEATIKTFRTNPVTREKEPYMPTWSRAIRYVASGSSVLFMICIVLAAVLGTIIYRISVVSVIYGGGTPFVKQHAKIFTTITAAVINLIIIMILTRIYHKVAVRLTNMENPRTHTEYEDSYTFKIFFFEFMNFYSSLIYIAFFKGRFYDYPGDDVARKSDFYRLKGDICDPAGCLSELCIQLAIIMVGKQCWNNFMEYLFPVFWNWWRQRKHKKQTKDETHLHMSWEQDYHMQDPGRMALFDEYLEMILQYGFVTLFVAAFPLAPLFALLNNIAEIRLDAFKMVTQARRPLAERVEDIGAWYGILRIITYTAVVSNAFVIAYTSDYIPRSVFKYVYSGNHTLVGYIDHSLSEFNTSHYKKEWGGTRSPSDPAMCQYRGYRNGPDHSNDPYGLSSIYWHVFAARLAFVVVFEHVVFVLTGIMQFIIPDIPVEVRTQIQREQLLAKEAKYQNGLKKSSTETEYNDLLNTLRDQTATGRQGGRASFARRMSRIGDVVDPSMECSLKPKRRSTESTVWEDT